MPREPPRREQVRRQTFRVRAVARRTGRALADQHLDDEVLNVFPAVRVGAAVAGWALDDTASRFVPNAVRSATSPGIARRVVRVALTALVVLCLLSALGAVVVRGPIAIRVVDRPVSITVSPERLRQSVEILSTRFRNRWITHPDTLDATASWIADRMGAAGLEVSDQRFTIMEGTVRNVVGVLTGRQPDAPILVVGAHYDAYGELPGADDNASGVAGLLELAETIPPEGRRRTIHFVAFVNEEPPFFGGDDMGSYRYAQQLAADGVEVDLMLSLEMIGCFSDEPGSQTFPMSALRMVYPGRGNFIAVIGDLGSGGTIGRVKRAMLETGAIPVYSFRGPNWVPGVDWSDHTSFRRSGFSAVMITDTAFLRNPRYHTRHDTADTLDFERMADVVRALHGVLRD